MSSLYDEMFAGVPPPPAAPGGGVPAGVPAPAPLPSEPNALADEMFGDYGYEKEAIGALKDIEAPTILERLGFLFGGASALGQELLLGNPLDALQQGLRGVHGAFTGDIAPEDQAFQGLRPYDETREDFLRSLPFDMGMASPDAAHQAASLKSKMSALYHTIADIIPGGFSREEAAKDDPRYASFGSEAASIYEDSLPELQEHYAGGDRTSPAAAFFADILTDPTTYIPAAVVAKGVGKVVGGVGKVAKVADKAVGSPLASALRTLAHGPIETAEAVGRRGETVAGDALKSAIEAMSSKSDTMIDELAKSLDMSPKEVKRLYGEELTKALEPKPLDPAALDAIELPVGKTVRNQPMRAFRGERAAPASPGDIGHALNVESEGVAGVLKKYGGDHATAFQQAHDTIDSINTTGLSKQAADAVQHWKTVLGKWEQRFAAHPEEWARALEETLAGEAGRVEHLANSMLWGAMSKGEAARYAEQIGGWPAELRELLGYGTPGVYEVSHQSKKTLDLRSLGNTIHTSKLPELLEQLGVQADIVTDAARSIVQAARRNPANRSLLRNEQIGIHNILRGPYAAEVRDALKNAGYDAIVHKHGYVGGGDNVVILRRELSEARKLEKVEVRMPVGQPQGKVTHDYIPEGDFESAAGRGAGSAGAPPSRGRPGDGRGGIRWESGVKPATSEPIGDVPFGPAPKEPWKKHVDIPEPDGKHVESVAVVIKEADGRVWAIEPRNAHGGRAFSVPGGTVEGGLTLQQTAIKEALEETGLHVKLRAHVRDVVDQNTGKVRRVYEAERIGGQPWAAKTPDEVAAVRLMDRAESMRFMSKGDDYAALRQRPATLQDEMRRPHEVKRSVKEIEERIREHTGLPKVPRGATTQDVARAVAEQFGAKYGREILDAVADTKIATGVGLSKREGYVLHSHTKPFQDWVKQSFGALPEAIADPARLDELLLATTGMDAKALDAAARKAGIWSGEMQFGEWLAHYGQALRMGGGKGKVGLISNIQGGDVSKLQRALGGTVEDINDFFQAIGFKPKKGAALETDGMRLLEKSGGQASRVVGTRRMVADMMAKVGYEGARQGLKDVKVSDILKRAGIPETFAADLYATIGDRWVPDEFVEDLATATKEMIDPGTPSRVLATVRGLNSWAQKNVIAWFPMYYKLNMATGIQQNLIWERMGPTRQIRRFTHAVKLMKQLGKNGRLTGKIKLGKRTIDGDELQALIEANDVLMPLQGTMSGARHGTSESMGLVGAARGPLARIAGAPGRMGTRLLKAGGGADNANRLGLFLELLDRGQDGISAAKRVNELHFPLDVLSRLERGTSTRMGIRDAAMFYSWPRHSLPFTVSMAMRHPKAHWVTGQVLQNVGEIDLGPGADIEGPMEYQPEKPFWMRENIRFGVKDDEGEVGVRRFRTLPEEFIETLEQARHPGRLIGRMSPLLKYGIERTTGRDQFYDQPISELYNFAPTLGGMVEKLPGLDYRPPEEGRVKGTVDPDVYHALRSIPPVGRAISTLQNLEKDPERSLLSGLAPLPFAQQTYEYDAEMWDRLRAGDRRRIFDEQIQPTAMRLGWMTKYGTFTRKGKSEAPDLYKEWLKMRGEGGGKFERARRERKTRPTRASR